MAEIKLNASADEPKRRTSRRARKRSNGEGTIYQRKDGRWEGAAFVLTTAGTYKRVRAYGRTHEEARKKLTQLVAQADQGIPVASENWTLAEFLAYWLKHIVMEEGRPKTYQGYEGVVRLHLVPNLGKKRLGKLSAQDIRLFINRFRKECQCCKHGWDASRERPACCALKSPKCCESYLSTRMVQSVHAVLRNALERAVREEIIPRNVAKLVTVSVPSYKVNRGLTAEEARRVLQASEKDRFHALYVLALCLGLRRGELLGLRWRDVDLDIGTLEVVQTLQRVGGELRFVRPKTENSERTVPLPQLCLDALKEHRKRQFAERSDAWPDWEDHGLVFPSRRGTPMEPDNLRRSWGAVRKTAGLGEMRFHDLRHTCVSLLLGLGVPPHIVREIVGHSDIEVTMTIYGHASLSEKRKALGKLGDALK
ncbi:Phage integrase, N-terminal SAM-like domain [Nonomuraea maritima]|uniref:Phage integrase, N-terminal SAM-like domain n=1 Tax=Nonomuraea maritima TaxID=683260 RepID=A0A1G9RJV1_9ACTN|nr:site-specific integrase [Nonomuraea maritima]SDM23187.1 Phage integrase, N-terminal SAM-like domain [Nonomuraea maritima]